VVLIQGKFREFKCHNLGDGYSGVWTESENPCPKGFRVPTVYEWRDVFNVNNNSREKIIDSTGSDIGWKIGSRLALFSYEYLDRRQWLWSTTVTDDEHAYIISVLYFKISEFKSLRRIGNAVRCIRKLPNE